MTSERSQKAANDEQRKEKGTSGDDRIIIVRQAIYNLFNLLFVFLIIKKF